MSTSNWKQRKATSNYHFDWQRQEMPGYDFRWISRFEGDWNKPLEKIKKEAKPKTWATRGKNGVVGEKTRLLARPKQA